MHMLRWALLFAAVLSTRVEAIVTYLTCPTLAPLPVTSFMPAAMLPIQNAKTAFETGMNVTIQNAVKYSSAKQLESINAAYTAMTKSLIQNNRTSAQQKMELDRSFDNMQRSYKGQLAAREMQMTTMFFPGDPALQLQPNGQEGVVSRSGPTYKMMQQICNTGKMQKALAKPSTRDAAIAKVNRRNQKILQSAQAMSSIDTAAKQTIDSHYDLFCSTDDKSKGLCESESLAPNADISAFNFLYPAGFRSEPVNTSSPYQSMYTYSPVESLASFSYIKNLAGGVRATPPTEAERNDPRKAQFVAMHRQFQAAISLSADVLLNISKLREPVNKSGVKLGELDLLSYQLMQNATPEYNRIVKSSSDTGKMKEIQRQIVIRNYIRYLQLQQKDAKRRLDAAEVSIKSSIESLKMQRIN